eukprot:5501458-Pleurochrysis_carterae.AAC.1
MLSCTWIVRVGEAVHRQPVATLFSSATWSADKTTAKRMSARQKVESDRNKVRRKHTVRLEHGARRAHAIRTCCPLRHAARG